MARFKPFVPGVLAVLLAGGLTTAYGVGFLNFGGLSVTCQVDEEIAPAERTAIAEAVTKFMSAAFGPQPASAYPMMTREVQSSMSADGVAAGVQATMRRSGAHANPKPLHFYVVQAPSIPSDELVTCGSAARTDWVAVEAKSGVTQAHVVVSTRSQNNDWESTIWLLREGTAWRVHNFYTGLSSLVGRSPDDVLKLARQQRDMGHAFNAAVLYDGFRATVDRGPAFQLGVSKTAFEEFKNFKAPSELTGKPPHKWEMSGSEYTVAQVGIVGQEGILGLTFELPQAAWNGDEDAEKRNHAFLDAFIATHPEYTDSFAFLVARALKPDGSLGFRTLHVVGVGYK